jgi:Cyclin, N-terminal domain/Cyclin, C-terminal domain
MSYIDRYMMTNTGKNALRDRKTFQLVAMTSLYIAVKIHEPEAMDPKVISSLSRGAYTEDEVTEMEMNILKALKWRMNPPTAMSFLYQYLSLLTDHGIPEYEMARVNELAKLQIDASVNVHSFVGVNPSSLAFAALSNALSILKLHCPLMKEALAVISKVSNISNDTEEIIKIHFDLFKVIRHTLQQSENSVPSVNSNASKCSGFDGSANCVDRPIHVSPRSVCP